MRAGHYDTGSIEDHIDLIRQRVEVSLQDPETRTLAASLVSGAFDSARDPRTGVDVPVVTFHGRHYMAAPSWADAAKVCRPRDYMCEVIAIWNFAVLNVRYTGDPIGRDMYQSIRTTLESGSADCDDACVVFAALLGGVGYESRARVISLDGRYWHHIYPLVKVPKKGWMALDITEDGKKPGWEYSRAAVTRDFDLV